MDIGKRFRTDKEKEKTGTWVPIDGSEFLIARSNNRKYKQSLVKALEENASELAAGTEKSAALDDKLLAEVMAETILLDWKKVEIDGKKINYSVKMAAKVMAEMPDFCDLIKRHADSIDNFKVDVEEKQTKNS